MFGRIGGRQLMLEMRQLGLQNGYARLKLNSALRCCHISLPFFDSLKQPNDLQEEGYDFLFQITNCVSLMIVEVDACIERAETINLGTALFRTPNTQYRFS